MTHSTFIQPATDGIMLRIRVVPNASRDQIVGLLGGALKVKVASPPEGGKANTAVCTLLARVLGVAKQNVSVDTGHTQPNKQIAVKGIDIATAHRALEAS